MNNSLLGTDSEPILHGCNYEEKREMASLTKIMTCYTVLKIMEKYSLNKHNTLITVSRWSSEQIGTTANLTENSSLSVWDLLHGLMLPSGNDAAIALSEHFGDFLLSKDQKKGLSPLTNKKVARLTSACKDSSSCTRESSNPYFPDIKRKKKEVHNDYTFSEAASEYTDTNFTRDSLKAFSMERSSCSRSFTDKFPIKPGKYRSEFRNSPSVSRFIKEMNTNAQLLGMKNTNYDSPHGLANRNNKSTAYDIALLCSV
jgi:hypothetical protein